METVSWRAVTNPSAASHRRWRGAALPLVVASGAAGVAVLLRWRDPHVSGSYGYCPFHELTGWWCPGCGGLRAVHNLTEGHVLAAVHSNLLLLPLLVAGAFWWLNWTRARWTGRRTPAVALSRAGSAVVLVGLLAFTVLRNTPWGTWLTPV